MSNHKNKNLYEIIYENNFDTNKMLFDGNNIIYKFIDDNRTKNHNTSSITTK